MPGARGEFFICADGSLRFHQVAAPTGEELSQLVHRLAQRVGRHLERQGLLQRDVENDYLTEDAFEAATLPPSRAPPRLELGDDWL